MTKEEMKEAYEKFIEAVKEVGLSNIENGVIGGSVHEHAIQVIHCLVFDFVDLKNQVSN